VSLIARHLEANGVPTIIMGCAKDLVEYCGAPRFLFSDFPLGNAAGKPNNPDSQAFTLELAMKVLETAPGPRTTVQSPLRWNEDGRWKLDFSNIDQETPEELTARKKAFDEVKEVAKKRREQDGLKVHAAE
jgi:hypothetical protein